MHDSELIEGFITDSEEMLEEIEPQLIELQKNFESTGTVDEEILNAIFRLFHSLKGAASFLQLENVTKVAHDAETMLNHLRDGKLTLSNNQIDVIFQALDLIRNLLSCIGETGNDRGLETQVEEIVQKLRNAYAGSDCSQHDQYNEESSLSGDTEEEDIILTSEAPEISITPDMKKQFVEESDELLEELEQGLLNLEKSADQDELLKSCFRNIHSFKGNCGFFGYSDLERLSHKSETVLEFMKSGAIRSDGDNVSTLLRIVDILRKAISDVAQGGNGSIEGLDILLDLLDEMIPEIQEENSAERQPVGEILINRGDTTSEAVEEALETQQKPLGEILIDMGKASPNAVKRALTQQQKQAKTRESVRASLRVDLDKLNELNDLVGELVTAQAMVIKNPDLQAYQFENFEKAAHHLEQISASLQDVAMSLRMIPVSGLFRKMMRLVHDLSRKSGKKVNLQMKGEDTEIDKTVIEAISDPLVHIIRNAVDHGIESPEERERLGKEKTGVVELEAKHEGGEIWIIVKDDGRGLDSEKILAKALEKGLAENSGTNLSQREIFNLIFEPGFSTATEVSDISGRGVGMDVVKKNIEGLNGRIDVQSTRGRGTSISMRIPLTLAIIDGMLVKSGNFRYLIPLLAVKKSFRPRLEHITVMPGGREVVRVREDLIPVTRLNQLFNFSNGKRRLDEGILVTLEHQGQSICLFVDEILGQMESVIKGLPKFMGNVQGISGCTILGDGEVSLILDVGGLMERAKH